MPSDDLPILPVIKHTIGRLSGLARTGLILCALLSIAELLFLSFDYIATGVLSGALSCLLLNLELPALSLLVLWCHDVLLPERGYSFTRFLCYLAVIFSSVCPVCFLYTALTGHQLLMNQALLPFIVCLLLELVHLTNLSNMGAATRLLKIKLVLYPVLTMFIFVFDQPGGLIFAGIGKLLLLLLLAQPLRQLANIAPRVISMPKKTESMHE